MTMHLADGGISLRAVGSMLRQGRDAPDPTPIDARRNAATGTSIQPGDGTGTLAMQIETLYAGDGVSIERRTYFVTGADGQPLAGADGEPEVEFAAVSITSGDEADAIVVHEVQANGDGGRTIAVNVNGIPFDLALDAGQGMLLNAAGGDDRILVDPEVASVLQGDAFVHVNGGAGENDYVWNADSLQLSAVEFAGAVPMSGVSVVAAGINDDGEPAGEPPVGPFDSMDEAAVAALDYANPLSMRDGLEYYGLIYRDPGTGLFHVTVPVVGEPLGIPPEVADSVQVPEGAEVVAGYHTHAAVGSPMFSQDDIDVADAGLDGGVIYAATPQGVVLRYEPTA